MPHSVDLKWELFISINIELGERGGRKNGSMISRSRSEHKVEVRKFMILSVLLTIPFQISCMVVTHVTFVVDRLQMPGLDVHT